MADISEIPARTDDRLRGRLIFAAKAAVSVALIAYLLGEVEPRAILSRAAGADWLPLAGALAAIATIAPLMGLRWLLALRGMGPRIPIGFSVRASFVGLFFGQFLPASVGSDVVRGWFAVRRGIALRDAVGSLLLDRMFGLLSFALLILASTAILQRIATPEIAAGALVAALAIVAAVGVAAMLARLPRGAIARPRPVTALLDMLRSARAGFWSAEAGGALAVSLAMHVGYALAAVLIARSLGISIGYGESVAVIATVTLLTNLPISFNGWGIREGAMVVGLGFLGIGPEDALTVSILQGLGLAVATLPGLPLWLTMRTRKAAPPNAC